MPARCGDGVIDNGEQCDDGNNVNTDPCPSICRNAVCGDGFTQEGSEQCDDGNTTDGDGCSRLCQNEPQQNEPQQNEEPDVVADPKEGGGESKCTLNPNADVSIIPFLYLLFGLMLILMFRMRKKS